MFEWVEKHPFLALFVGCVFLLPKFTFYVVSTMFCIYFLIIGIELISNFLKGK